MFRRKNKDRTSSLTTAYTGVESLPRGRHAANPAAVAAANNAGNDRLNSMSSTLSSAAAAAALMRHNSLTSINSQPGSYSRNGRANSLMGTSSTLRRPLSTSMSSSSFRSDSLTSRYSQGPARTTTTVERSNNGRTMSLTTTTVRRFGSFELVKTNTTTGQVRRPNRQTRPGYAASALSFESDLDPVYENGAFSSPKLDRAQQSSQIKFPTLEEEDEGDEHPIKHNPPPRSISPMRSALKESRSPSVTSSNDDQFSLASQPTNNNFLKVSNLKTSNSMSSKAKKPSRVSFADYEEDIQNESDNAPYSDPREVAARHAGAKDRKQRNSVANDGFLADHRKKLNATAAASAAAKSPSLANSADWGSHHRSFLKVRMDDSDSGASDSFASTEKLNKKTHRISRSTSDNNSFAQPAAIMNHAGGSLRKSASQKRTSGFFPKRKPDLSKFEGQSSDDSQARTLTSPTELKDPKFKSQLEKEKKKNRGVASAAVAFAATLVGEGRAENFSEPSSSDLGSSTAVSPSRSPLTKESAHQTVFAGNSDETMDESRTRTLTAGEQREARRKSETDGSLKSDEGFQTPESLPQENREEVEIMNLDDTRPLATKEGPISKGDEVSPYRALDPRLYDSEEENDKRTAAPAKPKTVRLADDIKKDKQQRAAVTTASKAEAYKAGGEGYPKDLIQRVQSMSTDDLLEEDYSDALDAISMNSDSSWKNSRQPKAPRKVVRVSMRSQDTVRVTPASRPVSVLRAPPKPGKRIATSPDMVAPPRNSQAFRQLSLRHRPTGSETRPSEADKPNFGFKSRFADSDSEDDDLIQAYHQSLDETVSKVNKGGLLNSLRPRTSKKSLRFSPTLDIDNGLSMSNIAEAAEQGAGSPGGSKLKHVFSPTNQTKYLVSKSGTETHADNTSTQSPSTTLNGGADYPRKKRFSGLRKLFKLD